MISMSDDTTEVQVILGPYRDSRLTMPKAEASAAINDHWAVDPFAPLDEKPHDPLTEQERQHAYEASMTWAKAQWAEEPEPKAKDQKRDMTPHPRGEYETKDIKPPVPPAAPAKPR
jgi:hypothetical protein